MPFDSPISGDALVPGCGNGAIEVAEECDDGNLAPGDGCSALCEVEAGWVCVGNPSLCSNDCGDGVVDAPESCDGTNLGGQDCTTVSALYSGGTLGCTEECQLDTTACVLATCGNGAVDPGEECDDGNLTDTDDCPSNCQAAECGDGHIWTGPEECDDGNSDNTDNCIDDCQSARCGDGHVWAGQEACDDGNTTNGDGCEASCQLTCAGGAQQPCGSCGTQTCGADHQWSACEEYCEGRACGPDICGGSCGSCAWWESCNSNGQCTSPCVSPPCVASVGDHPDVYAAYSHVSSTCAAWTVWTLANAVTTTAPITGCDDGTTCGWHCLDSCATCQCTFPSWCPTMETCTNCASPFLAADSFTEQAWPTFWAGTLVAASGFNNDWVFHYYFQEPTAPKPNVCLREPSVGRGCLEHPCGSGVCIPNTDIHLADYSQQAFHLEVLQDGNRLVLLANAWVAHGAMAAATYFESTVASNLASYTNRWYVYLWEDSDLDDYPDPQGIDTYTLLTSGN